VKARGFIRSGPLRGGYRRNIVPGPGFLGGLESDKPELKFLGGKFG